MRLLKTLLASALVLALTGTAFAMNTHDERTVFMGGTTHLKAGGPLRMQIGRKPHGKIFKVRINYDVAVKSATRLQFTIWPCKTPCQAPPTTTKTNTLTPSPKQHLFFSGRTQAIKRSDGLECVFAQIRDLGPSGKGPGKIVRRHGLKGVRVCHG
jgi:hypothetical protein